MTAKAPLASRFADALDNLLAGASPPALGVAVSGGGDSTALLYLMAGACRARDIRLLAATVDHGIRPEAAEETELVASQCAELGVSHDLLRWSGWDGKGNLQDRARRARYRLIADWAGDKGIDAVALGHTLDDQAETVLLRLLRGSGVDGLSGMSARRHLHGIAWLRPLLGERRDSLRDWLTETGRNWSEDPSNEDTHFDRVKARKALASLEGLGLTAEGLAETASRMAMARTALELATLSAVTEIATTGAGAVFLDRSRYLELPEEIGRRLLVHSLRWVASAEYAPRHSALLEVRRAIENGTSATLHGCLITVSGGQCIISREPGAVAGRTAAVGGIWDGRWLVSGPACTGCEVRMLGEKGLKSCPDWRQSGYPRQVLLATPAVWKSDELVAAPLAGHGPGYRAELMHGKNHFATSILSH